jgi:uncharacterized protein (TIGR03790 family)
MMMRLLVLSICAALLAVPPALAQSGANVLLVVNAASAESARIAEHYARVREVPPDQVLRINAGIADEIGRAAFAAQIEAPIAVWLQQHFAHDRILYIVLTRGVPLRITGTAGREGTTASVDSELTLLYRRLAGLFVPVEGRVPNPYFLGTAPVAQAKRFSREASDLFLVTRLDGFTAADAIGLIDRGAAPMREGWFVLDQKAGAIDGIGNEWLAAAADRLAAAGFAKRVELDTTSRVLSGRKDVLGYYSWGSNDWAITARRFGFGFVPGAIAGMFVSTDGRTFSEPPAGWTIGTWTDKATYFAGSPQSLAGDLIREGVTGVSAHVAEPFLDAAIRPDILFPAYVAGFNLAESYYLAMPYLSWQTVIVGDPLCAPFRKTSVPPATIDNGIDPDTGLPAYFAARHLQAVIALGAKPDAARAVLRAEARMAKGDLAGAQQAFEEATAIDPKLTGTHMVLAARYEDQGEFDKAIERYRAVLSVAPDSVAALNNLAYALAVRKGQPAEALPHAELAMSLSGGRSPDVADTLAWTQHLMGRDADAVKIFEKLAKAVPDRAEFRLHAAVVFATVGRLEEAAANLEEAVRLDSRLEGSPEAKALRSKLGK